MLGRKWKPKYMTPSKETASGDAVRQGPEVKPANKQLVSKAGAKKKKKLKAEANVLSTKSE